MNVNAIIGRKSSLFSEDIRHAEEKVTGLTQASRFLVIGGAGSIGQAVAREIFKRNPRTLHIVDISENNLVELVRDIRSSLGYISGDFRTFAIDCGSPEFQALATQEGPYDYVLNLSALKHVRSEKDPYTLMRMINTNITNTINTVRLAAKGKAKKYFSVSTDKAANPVNMMGASKRIMEMFLARASESICLSMARFANVAFSDGSLLHGFNQRLLKSQPLAAPRDVRRYFLTPQESGELCLLSCLLGDNLDNFFPKPSNSLPLTTFSEIAIRYLEQAGYQAHECESEEEARTDVQKLKREQRYPCYFFSTDTTGEKGFEEFFTEDESLDMTRYLSIGVIKNEATHDPKLLRHFTDRVEVLRSSNSWTREDLVKLFHEVLPDFKHKDTGKFLDGRM